jgi:hypothetical protein|tara:strand:- start:771 stop:1331 length:561 start_codon:yes stop_codon:yes gene_type:complete
MKYNIILNKFMKNNYSYILLLIYVYLINCIINNNFYETFFIFGILIIGYLLINYNIFYLLLILIILNKLFFNFNTLNEGIDNSPGCIPNPNVQRLLDRSKRYRYPRRPPPDPMDKDAEDIDDEIQDNLNKDDYSKDDDASISQDCATKSSTGEARIGTNSREPVGSMCGVDTSSLLGPSMKYNSYE